MRSLTLERLDSYYQRLSMLTSDQQADNGTPSTHESTDPGGHARMEPTDFERGYPRGRRARHAENTAEFLAGVRGRRKAVLFFSEGIDYPITDSFGGHSATDVIRATQDAITMAARANVNYFTIDPRGLVGMTTEFMEMQGGARPSWRVPRDDDARHQRRDDGHHRRHGPFNAQTELMHELQLSQGSLRELAEETGGIAAVNSNSLTSTRSSASSRRTAATTSSATTRLLIRATAASTRSRSA